MKTLLPAAADDGDAPARSLLIVDDHAAMRAGLVRLVRELPIAWNSVHAAESASKARELLNAHAPDVVILDVDLAGDNGLDLLPEIVRHSFAIVITSCADSVTRRRALALGATAFIDKHAPGDQLASVLVGLLAPQVRGDDPPARSGVTSDVKS